MIKKKIEEVREIQVFPVKLREQFEEENSHVILLRIDSGFTIDNIAGLYSPFKIEENETALSKAKIQLLLLIFFKTLK